MGRRLAAVLAALVSCFCVANGELNWFVHKSEFAKIVNDIPPTSDGERERERERENVCVFGFRTKYYEASYNNRAPLARVCVCVCVCVCLFVLKEKGEGRFDSSSVCWTLCFRATTTVCVCVL